MMESERQELLTLLQVMSQPKTRGFTQDLLDQALINFCAKCPDPVQARWLIVECLDPMSDAELVDRVMDMPPLPMSDVPMSIIPINHPARAPGGGA
jgi:hypothetical protein